MIDDLIFAPIQDSIESTEPTLIRSTHTGSRTRRRTVNTSGLDLAVLIDCTISMKPYIQDVKNKVREIVSAINSADIPEVRFALIRYRDHPPQEMTFVTRVHGFTDAALEMNQWLEEYIAQGGGDAAEAVADAVYDALNLPWRPEAAKICILLSDAPPHGYEPTGDAFPDGCPCGLDPLMIAQMMSRKKIILCTVGVGSHIDNDYRSYLQTLAQITHGEYVSMANVELLTRMIIDGLHEVPHEAL